MFLCRAAPLSALEDLPDELLLIICRYLHLIEILFAFSGLNVRLNRLLVDFSRKIDLNLIPSRWIDRFEKTIFPSIHCQVQSLVLNDDYQRVPLDFSRFVALQSLEIRNDFSLDYLLNIREIQLNFLPVDVQIQHDLIDRFFFSPGEHSQLRSLSLVSYHGLTFSSYSSRSSSPLTRLKITLKNNIDLFALLDILSLTIEELIVEIIYNGPLRDLSLLEYHFDHLRLFRLKTIFEDSIKFDQLEQIVTQSFPYLEDFALETFTRDPAFLNGFQWEIFLRKLTFLRRFSCSIRYRFKINDHDQEEQEITQYEQILHSFSTPFWLVDHRWFVSVYSTTPSPEENQSIPHFKTKTYGKLFLFTNPYAYASIDVSRDLNKVQSTAPNRRAFWNVRHLYFDGENLPLADRELKNLLNQFRWINELKLDRLIVPDVSTVRLKLPQLTRLTIYTHPSSDKLRFSWEILDLPSMFNLRYLRLPQQCLPPLSQLAPRVETLFLTECRDLHFESLVSDRHLRVLRLSLVSFDRLLDNHGELIYQLISSIFRVGSSIESLQLMCPGSNRTKIQLFHQRFLAKNLRFLGVKFDGKSLSIERQREFFVEK